MELFGSVGALRGSKVLEVGAGASRWLPYLGITLDAEAWGLDYSAIGCELARDALARVGVPGTVLQRDLFDPNEDLVERFDLVYSLGLVEHFGDTSGAVGAVARFARRGGWILTAVPNMCGLMGALQQLADRSVYAQHARLTPHGLRHAHETNGLTILRQGWFGSYDPAVVNEGSSPLLTERALSAGRFATRTLIWTALRVLRVRPETRLLSPYVICLARRSRA